MQQVKFERTTITVSAKLLTKVRRLRKRFRRLNVSAVCEEALWEYVRKLEEEGKAKT